MSSESEIRSRLLQYLAGRLTDPERALFEERLLSDQDFSDSIAVLEQEVIDAYSVGALNPEDAGSIRGWIEGSPRRMERVRIAQAFLKTQQRAGPRTRYLAVVLAAAACILIAAGVSLALFNRLAEKERRVSLPQAAAPAESVSPQSPSSMEKKAPKTAVVLLVAERIRGAQETLTYQIKPESPVELQILLAGGTENGIYSLEIISLSKEHKVHLKRDNLRARTEAGRVFIDTSFPPHSLPHASYEVVVDDSGTTLTSTFVVR